MYFLKIFSILARTKSHIQELFLLNTPLTVYYLCCLLSTLISLHFVFCLSVSGPIKKWRKSNILNSSFFHHHHHTKTNSFQNGMIELKRKYLLRLYVIRHKSNALNFDTSNFFSWITLFATQNFKTHLKLDPFIVKAAPLNKTDSATYDKILLYCLHDFVLVHKPVKVPIS